MCEVALTGTLDLVFVSADSEFSVELKNVLYSPNSDTTSSLLAQSLTAPRTALVGPTKC
ncbi:unnamed protein product [Ectocarpus sp. CCAP 1310/34]|nr:unnamed protein product [Ectocarpus sp. CCAP 1310/34]